MSADQWNQTLEIHSLFVVGLFNSTYLAQLTIYHPYELWWKVIANKKKKKKKTSIHLVYVFLNDRWSTLFILTMCGMLWNSSIENIDFLFHHVQYTNRQLEKLKQNYSSSTWFYLCPINQLKKKRRKKWCEQSFLHYITVMLLYHFNVLYLYLSIKWSALC